MGKERLTGGQMTVKSLLEEGIDTVFGLPGVQNDWLYNGLYDYRDRIRVIHTRHEQGAGYMSLGYHLASGRPSVCSVVPGPGFLNSSAALATAWGLNAQVLWLVGQIPSRSIGKGRGVLHEIPDQLSILNQFTKWSTRSESPQSIPGDISEAFGQLRSGRPRPVGVEIPMDVLKEKAEFDFDSYDFQKGTVPEARQSQIEETSQWIRESRRPLIFVGSGALNASDEITALSEKYQIPVFSYRTGKGVVSARSALSLAVPAAHPVWAETDLAICIGSHMRMPLGKWGVDDNMRLTSINIDSNDHPSHGGPHIHLTADAGKAVSRIVHCLDTQTTEPHPTRKWADQLGAEWDKTTEYLEPQRSWLRIIREELPDDGIFVDELTQAGFASRMLYEAYLPRTYLSTGFMGTLGWGFQTALGAKVAKPDAPVITVTGDGGFMFGIQELATAVQNKIGVVILLFNNHLFGNVRNMQEQLYGGRVIATDLHNPDFVQLAKNFGANACRVEGLPSLRAAIRKATKEELPTLIEIPVGTDLPSTDRLKSLPKVRGL